ncbi:MAG: hypothetical protein JWN57_993 [Frankiales bacterium]|nr:hypothetical protein [Frankiales bacterium]
MVSGPVTRLRMPMSSTKPSVWPQVRPRSLSASCTVATRTRSPYRSTASASVSPTCPTSGSVNVTHGTTRSRDVRGTRAGAVHAAGRLQQGLAGDAALVGAVAAGPVGAQSGGPGDQDDQVVVRHERRYGSGDTR